MDILSMEQNDLEADLTGEASCSLELAVRD